MALAAVSLAPTTDRFADDLRDFINKYAGLWESAGSRLPLPAKHYETKQQRENERHLDLLIDLVESRLKGFPDSLEEQSVWRENIVSAARRLCVMQIGLPEPYLDILLSREYTEVTRNFVRQARDFDPQIALVDLGQAMRNVWVTNYLQIFKGRQPSLNTAVFAYSMLYPYTDNHLDRPDVSPESKAAFNRRFGLRLGGAGLLPLEPHERQIYRLVELIERRYPRREFPEVYQSLLAIHHGQVRSLEQQGAGCALDSGRILLISIEKGGTSVLTDGYLIDGRLSRAEADFFFGFGVLLQLQDDLQDLQSDRSSQRWSIFSRAESGARLEALTCRLYHFMKLVLEADSGFSDSRYATLRELVASNCFILMLQSIAQNSSYYGRAFVDHMESFSLLRFAYMRKLLHRLERKHAGVMKSYRRRRHPVSVFDLIG